MCMTGRRANTTTSLDVRQSDTRVQVDVGFIEVEHFLFGAGVIHQTLNIVKDFPPSANGNSQGRSWAASTAFLLAQYATEMGLGKVHTRIFKQLQSEQFQGPCCTLPTIVAWRPIKVLQQLCAHWSRRLPGSTLQSLIQKPLDALVPKAVQRHIDRRTNTPYFLLHLAGRFALRQKRNNSAPLCLNSALRSTHQLLKGTTLHSGQFNTYLHCREVSWGSTSLIHTKSVNP